jgi:predicted amidophosphoribosyltransferase
VAAFAYEGVAREVVARLKYRDARSAAGWLADAIVTRLRLVTSDGFDVVTWAPASVARVRAHGVDHASLLARAVAGALDLPASALLARRPGPAQTGASWTARRRGPDLSPRREVAGANVLVVDDVATTGATATAAARALRSAGATGVVFATAARTPRPGVR